MMISAQVWTNIADIPRVAPFLGFQPSIICMLLSHSLHISRRSTLSLLSLLLLLFFFFFFFFFFFVFFFLSLFRTLRETAYPPTEGQGELGRETREGRHTDLKFGQNLDKTWIRIRTQNDAENHQKSSYNSSWEGPQDTQTQSRHPPWAPSSEEKPDVTQQVPKNHEKFTKIG